MCGRYGLEVGGDWYDGLGSGLFEGLSENGRKPKPNDPPDTGVKCPAPGPGS